MIYVPSRVPSTLKPSLTQPRDIEGSRSSSTRTINPTDCTDECGDQETASNCNVKGDDDPQLDFSDVVLVDRAIANSDENVKQMTILLVGNSNAGKSSFVYWSRERKFNTNLKVTTGVNPSFMGARINGQHYVVTLMDTAGTERFHSTPQNLYRYIDGAIIMYDITDFESFQHVTTWKQRVERNCRNDNIPYILVGNKVDIEGHLHIEGEQVAKDLKMDSYLKTSALTGEGIDTAIKTIIALASKGAATHQSVNQSIKLERRARRSQCC